MKHRRNSKGMCWLKIPGVDHYMGIWSNLSAMYSEMSKRIPEKFGMFIIHSKCQDLLKVTSESTGKCAIGLDNGGI